MLNIPWIGFAPIAEKNPLFRVDLTPYSPSIIFNNEAIDIPQVDLLGWIFYYYFLIVGFLAIVSGVIAKWDIGLILCKITRNNIIYIVLYGVFSPILLLIILDLLTPIKITYGEEITLSIPSELIISDMTGILEIPIKFSFNYGLIFGISALILAILNNRYNR
jgi:hypothetical protein